jgi:hypothetical protein
MISAQCHLTPTDRRIEAAIKAIHRRTGRPAKMTAIRGALNFTVSVSTARRCIWRLEYAGLIYRYTERAGYYAGAPHPHAATHQSPLPPPQWEQLIHNKAFNTSVIATRQTELRLLVEVGRPSAAPTKPRPAKRETTRADAPQQLALPIPDAA